MNKAEYRNACSYARKLTNDDYRDIVHDAYVDHYTRTGKDLFEEHNKTIVATVKYHYFNCIRSRRFMYRGENFQKKFYSLNLDKYQEGSPVTDTEIRFGLHSHDELMDGIIMRDQVNTLGEMITPHQRRLLIMAIEGNTQQDIVKIEGVNQSSVRKSFIRIQKKAKLLNIMSKNWVNPFNGSRTVVTRVISERQYKDKVDHNDYELEDENEYYRIFIHKESKEGLLVRVSNPIGSEFYIKRGEDNINGIKYDK